MNYSQASAGVIEQTGIVNLKRGHKSNATWKLVNWNKKYLKGKRDTRKQKILEKNLDRTRRTWVLTPVETHAISNSGG